jgi:hypothetical protein
MAFHRAQFVALTHVIFLQTDESLSDTELPEELDDSRFVSVLAASYFEAFVSLMFCLIAMTMRRRSPASAMN